MSCLGAWLSSSMSLARYLGKEIRALVRGTAREHMHLQSSARKKSRLTLSAQGHITPALYKEDCRAHCGTEVSQGASHTVMMEKSPSGDPEAVPCHYHALQLASWLPISLLTPFALLGLCAHLCPHYRVMTHGCGLTLSISPFIPAQSSG
jgi:hypothetical protein